MKIHLFSVPYDSGRRSWRTGAGPERILAAGLADRLAEAGHEVATGVIDVTSDGGLAEIATAFALNRQLAEGVRSARAAGEFPVVLGGNCGTALGAVSGIGTERTALLWFDAHGDFNTPETTLGGFLDGMGLAIVAGRCFGQLALSVRGFAPVREDSILLIGVRDLDPLEDELLQGSAVRVMTPERMRTDFAAALDSLPERAEQAHLHIDLDVLDPSVGRANALHAEGGLSLDEMRAAIEATAERLPIGAVTFASYDPCGDEEGRICEAAMELVDAVVAARR